MKKITLQIHRNPLFKEQIDKYARELIQQTYAKNKPQTQINKYFQDGIINFFLIPQIQNQIKLNISVDDFEEQVKIYINENKVTKYRAYINLFTEQIEKQGLKNKYCEKLLMIIFEKELTGNKLHTQLKKKILCVLLLVDFELKELQMDVNQYNLKHLWQIAFPSVPLDYRSITDQNISTTNSNQSTTDTQPPQSNSSNQDENEENKQQIPEFDTEIKSNDQFFENNDNLKQELPIEDVSYTPEMSYNNYSIQDQNKQEEEEEEEDDEKEKYLEPE